MWLLWLIEILMVLIIIGYFPTFLLIIILPMLCLALLLLLPFSCFYLKKLESYANSLQELGGRLLLDIGKSPKIPIRQHFSFINIKLCYYIFKNQYRINQSIYHNRAINGIVTTYQFLKKYFRAIFESTPFGSEDSIFSELLFWLILVTFYVLLTITAVSIDIMPTNVYRSLFFHWIPFCTLPLMGITVIITMINFFISKDKETQLNKSTYKIEFCIFMSIVFSIIVMFWFCSLPHSISTIFFGNHFPLNNDVSGALIMFLFALLLFGLVFIVKSALDDEQQQNTNEEKSIVNQVSQNRHQAIKDLSKQLNENQTFRKEAIDSKKVKKLIEPEKRVTKIISICKSVKITTFSRGELTNWSSTKASDRKKSINQIRVAKTLKYQALLIKQKFYLENIQYLYQIKSVGEFEGLGKDIVNLTLQYTYIDKFNPTIHIQASQLSLSCYDIWNKQDFNYETIDEIECPEYEDENKAKTISKSA